jgi:hypothetical protein
MLVSLAAFLPRNPGKMRQKPARAIDAAVPRPDVMVLAAGNVDRRG